MHDLAGRVAVIHGAGSGIGRATAIALAREGTAVAVCDRETDRCAETATIVEGEGVGALALRCDVTSDDDLRSVHDACLERWGRIDIVMNNVGLPVAGMPLDFPLDAWQRAIDVNLLSVVRSNHVFLPTLLARGSGHVVNTASTAGLYPYSYQRLPYSAAKAGVIALSEALALYLRPRGVGVSCLCPATVTTRIAETIETFGEPGTVPSPGFPALSADAVAERTVAAIRGDTFLVLTNPEVGTILRERARDPEGFLRQQEAALRG